MSELEKAALNHRDELNSYLWSSSQDCSVEYAKEAFIAGAQWQAKQSPWISVEDALPKESAKGLAKVKYLDGSEGEMLMGHVSKWVYPYIKTGYITHWCLIHE